MRTYTEEELSQLLEEERKAMKKAILFSCKCTSFEQLKEYARIGKEISETKINPFTKEANPNPIIADKPINVSKKQKDWSRKPRREDLSNDAFKLMDKYDFDIYSSVMGYLGCRKPRTLETTIKRYMNFIIKKYPDIESDSKTVSEIVELCWKIHDRKHNKN